MSVRFLNEPKLVLDEVEVALEVTTQESILPANVSRQLEAAMSKARMGFIMDVVATDPSATFQALGQFIRRIRDAMHSIMQTHGTLSRDVDFLRKAQELLSSVYLHVELRQEVEKGASAGANREATKASMIELTQGLDNFYDELIETLAKYTR